MKLKLIAFLFACLMGSIAIGKSNKMGKDNTDRPNILWITCEDISPYLGCYGFKQAQTPNLDRLAENGIRYTHAYPVKQILEVAKVASSGDRDKVSAYLEFMADANPVIRFWGAYAVFLTRPSGPDVQSVLKGMIQKDNFAANRIMAAQAIGVCGDPEIAFQSIMKEASLTNHNYVFLQALNAFQYSQTDNRLTIEDWKKLKEKKFPANDAGASLGYPNRIIDDALTLWPERRKVY